MAVQPTESYLPAVDEFAGNDDLDARPAQASSTAVQSGWDAAEALVTSNGDFPVDFKFNDGEFQVIKFIDQSGPFAIYRQHFLQQKAIGKKSYVCLGSNCPLCRLPNKPEDKRGFTIANLSAPGGVQRQVLTASTRLYKQLHQAEFSPAGPLTKNYWAVSRSGKMQQTVYHLTPIKARDLQEDWNINAEEAEKAIAEMVPYERAIIKEHSWAELEEIAQDLLA